MHAGQVVILMTSAALNRIHAVSIGSAPYLHCMRMAVIPLTRKISRRVAIHAAGMTQYGNDFFESGSARSLTHTRCGLRGGIA
jgi:hypothetical protein